MRINRWIVPLVMVAVLFGSVGVGRVFGWWQTTGQNLTTVEGVTPEDIRGSSSLGDLSEAFDIPMPELYQILGIPDTLPPETQLKELEAYNEVGAVRGLVAEHLGLPWEWSEDHDQPVEAAPVDQGSPSTQEHTEPAPVVAGELLAADIKGRMTLREISDGTGMPLPDLYSAVGIAQDIDPNTALRDIKTKMPEFEVDLVRQAVAAYQANR